MRQAMTIFCAVAFGATASWAQETDSSQPRDPNAPSTMTLPFKLEANQTYDFRATCEKSGATNDPAQRGETRLHYRLTSLRDSASGGGTISIMIDADAAHAPKGERLPTEPGNTGEEIDKTKNPGDKSKAEELLGRDRHERKVVTVVVDSTGKITSVKGMEEFRAQARAADASMDQAAIDAVETHIALILGSGLHGQTLQPGQLYSISAASGGALSQPAGSVPKSPTEAKPNTDKVTDATPVNRDHVRSVGALPKLRFEGVSGDRANFVMVDAAAPQTATGADATKRDATDATKRDATDATKREGTDATKREGNDEAVNRASKVAGVGTASYSTKDGLLQSLNGRVDSAMAGIQKPNMPLGARFSIERVGSDARIEPPR